MSAEYSLYTEIEIDGIWHAVNGRVLNTQTMKPELSETYHSGSRSYFSQSMNKIREIGFHLSINDLSKAVKDANTWIGNDKSVPIYGCSLSALRKCVPNPAEHECHGFVTKDDIFAVEHGELEESMEALSVSEYRELDDEEKKAYSYYEWDASDGWYATFREILEHVKWQLREWEDVNFQVPDDEKIRVVLICG